MTTHNALSIAETTFHLLITGPSPLALDGTAIGHGLPARMVDLGELREIMLAPGSSEVLKDAVWAELVRRARSGDPDWVIGCVGVALPGLKNVAAHANRTCPAGLAEDVVSELLAEFIAQLGKIDIGRGRIGARLVFWARKGALRARGREVQYNRLDPATATQLARSQHGERVEPAAVLREAVRLKVIDPAEAELIEVTRLECVTLLDYARALGVPADRLYKRRKSAEARLAAAIAEGQVLAITADWVSDSGC